MSRESKAHSHQIESYEPLVLMSASAAEIDITCGEDACCAKSLFLQYLDGFRNLIEETMVCEPEETGADFGLTSVNSLLQQFDSCIDVPQPTITSGEVLSVAEAGVSAATVGFQEVVARADASAAAAVVTAFDADTLAGPQIPDTFHVETGAVLASIVSGGALETGNNRVSLEFELLTPPADGVLEFREDGSFAYLADEGCAALQSFTYQIFDVEGNSEIRTVELSCDSFDTVDRVAEFVDTAANPDPTEATDAANTSGSADAPSSEAGETTNEANSGEATSATNTQNPRSAEPVTADPVYSAPLDAGADDAPTDVDDRDNAGTIADHPGDVTPDSGPVGGDRLNDGSSRNDGNVGNPDATASDNAGPNAGDPAKVRPVSGSDNPADSEGPQVELPAINGPVVELAATSSAGSVASVQLGSTESPAWKAPGPIAAPVPSLASGPNVTNIHVEASSSASASASVTVPGVSGQAGSNTTAASNAVPPSVAASLKASASAASLGAANTTVLINGTSASEVLDGAAAAETLQGGDGNDTLFGRDGDDVLSGGSGSDNIVGGTGADTVSGGSGDDHIWLNHEYGNDHVSGGEQGESQGDTLYLNFAAGQQQVLLSGQGAGTVSNGISTAQFAELEHIILSNNSDVLILTPGFSIGSIGNFTLPTIEADGSLTVVDTINVAALQSATGEAVTTANVVVSEDTDGSAVLTFPNGESLKLTDVTAADLRQPGVLNAIGLTTANVQTAVDAANATHSAATAGSEGATSEGATSGGATSVAIDASASAEVWNSHPQDFRGSLFVNNQISQLQVTLVNDQPALGWNGIAVSGGQLFVAANGEFEFHPDGSATNDSGHEVRVSLTTVNAAGQTQQHTTTLIFPAQPVSTPDAADVGSGSGASVVDTNALSQPEQTTPADDTSTESHPTNATEGPAAEDPATDGRAANTSDAAASEIDRVDITLGTGDSASGSLQSAVPSGSRITAVNGVEVLGWNGVPLADGGTLYMVGRGDFDYYPGDTFADLPEGESRDVTFEYSVTDEAGQITNRVMTLVITKGDSVADSHAANSDPAVAPNTGSTNTTSPAGDAAHPVELPRNETPVADTAVGDTPSGGETSHQPDAENDFSADVAPPAVTQPVDSQPADSQPGDTQAGDTPNDTGSLPHKVVNPDVIEVTADDTNALDGNLLANDAVVKGRVSAVNGQPLTGDFMDLPQGGRILVSENGDFNFDPAGDFDSLLEGTSQEITFTYTAVDEAGVPCEVTATIVVNGSLPHKVVNPDVIEVTADDTNALDGNLLANDAVVKGRVSAVNGQPLTGDFMDLPQGGRILVSENGDFNFDPAGDFDSLPLGTSLEITFTYTAVDEAGVPCEVTATIIITGTDTADTPDTPAKSVGDDRFEVDAQSGTLFDGNLLANDDLLSGRVISVNGHPANGFNAIPVNGGGQVFVSTDGEFRFDPNGDFDNLQPGETREVSFTYLAVDEHGQECEATVTIVVKGPPAETQPPEPPEADDPTPDPTPDPVLTASLGDRIWFDANRDGLQSEGELGAPGIRIILLDGDRNIVAETVTDADGRYRFDDLPPGKYKVDIDETTLPAGFVPTTTNAGDDNRDSDLDTSRPLQDTELEMTELEAGEVDLSHDLGLVDTTTASLGDRIWFDTNRDGLQSEGELGAPGIRVILLDGNRNIVAETVTDADGRYQFDRLLPGKYKVDIDETTLPEGFVPTITNAGDDNRDSDLDTSRPIQDTELEMTELEAGELDLSHDLGLVERTTASLGDRIWFDTNGDGLQSEGELGAPGIRIILLDGNRNIVAETVTDADGRYRFDGLPPGKYKVDIDETTLPVGFVPTTTNAGDDNRDSDLDTSRPLQDTELEMTELEAGEVDLSHDLGLVAEHPAPPENVPSLGEFIERVDGLLPGSIQFKELETDSLLLTGESPLDPSQLGNGIGFPFNGGGLTPSIPIPQFGGVGGSSINLFGVDLPTAGLPIEFELPDPSTAGPPAPEPAPAAEPAVEPDSKERVAKDDDCVTYEYDDCEPADSYHTYEDDC